MPSRNGLRTLQVGTAGAERRRLTASILAGMKTTAARTVDTRAPAEPLETPGERLFLVDDSGHTAAVLEVDAVEVNPSSIRVHFHVVGLDTT